MIDNNMISSTAKLYLSQCETISSVTLQETILISINECTNLLNSIKIKLKKTDSFSMIELLNLLLSVSSLTKELENNYELFNES